MEFHVLDYGVGGEGAKYLDQFLRARRKEFIDVRGWANLNHSDGREFDVYDVGAKYALLVEYGEVLAGARLLRTDGRMAAGYGARAYRYMILDACEGFLPGMPSALCDEQPPCDPAVWEVTRILSAPGRNLGVSLYREINRFLFSVGARATVFIGPPVFLKLLGRKGFSIHPLGPVFGEGRERFQAMWCDILPVNLYDDMVVDARLDALIDLADASGYTLDELVAALGFVDVKIFKAVCDNPSNLPLYIASSVSP